MPGGDGMSAVVGSRPGANLRSTTPGVPSGRDPVGRIGRGDRAGGALRPECHLVRHSKNENELPICYGQNGGAKMSATGTRREKREYCLHRAAAYDGFAIKYPSKADYYRKWAGRYRKWADEWRSQAGANQ
jgi:hypothetical protein